MKLGMLLLSALLVPTQIFAAPKTAGRLGDIVDPHQPSLEDLTAMAFDERLTMEARWTATTRMGKQFGEKAKASLEKALRSNDWYMRNAALVVLHYGNRNWAVDWSKKLLDDPSLVVRTAAVHSLRQLGAVESQDLLWKKLNAKENFRGGQSLWVRHHIAQALGDFATEGGESSFAKLLSDSDPRVRSTAVKTLSKITKLDFKTEHEWQNYFAHKQL